MAVQQPLLSRTISIVLDASTVACASDFSLSRSMDVIEITCLSSTGAKQNVTDQYSWTASLSGTRLETTGVEAGKLGYDEIVPKFVAGEDVSIYFLPDVSANTYEVGNAVITSLSTEGGVGSAVTYSVELTGNGPLYQVDTP